MKRWTRTCAYCHQPFESNRDDAQTCRWASSRLGLAALARMDEDEMNDEERMGDEDEDSGERSVTRAWPRLEYLLRCLPDSLPPPGEQEDPSREAHMDLALDGSGLHELQQAGRWDMASMPARYIRMMATIEERVSRTEHGPLAAKAGVAEVRVEVADLKGEIRSTKWTLGTAIAAVAVALGVLQVILKYAA